MKKICLIMTLLSALATSGCAAKEPLLNGTVEATILPHYAEVSATIVASPLELGQPVAAGDIVAVLDDSRERYNIEQLEAALTLKQAVLAELLSGADAEELRQAQNNVRLAEQALSLAKLEEERAQKDAGDARLLYEQGAATEKTLSDAQYRVELAAQSVTSAATRLDNARQQSSRLVKGVAEEKIDAARADIALTESQLRQSEDNLARYTVRAAQAGVVISKNYYTGAVVNAGYDLADIAGTDELYVTAYLPEDYLHSVTYGQSLSLRGADGECAGTVAYIDMQAQYTPKENQTAANRNKSSYKIKILLPADVAWRPGETVDVVL